MEGDENSTSVIYPDVDGTASIFVTDDGEIYVDNGGNRRVDKLSLNPKENVPVMEVDGLCRGIFADIEDNLYCSLNGGNRVVKKSLKNNTNTITVAGIGLMGLQPNRLAEPCGIFVDINFDLYVADSGNNRIQLFHPENENGTTIVMTGLTKELKQPTGVVLDGNSYLFIVDKDNDRVIGSGPYGFRCIVGCGISGAGPNHLNGPMTLSFDTYGNIFVADVFNTRIQKFTLKNNFCGNLSMKES